MEFLVEGETDCFSNSQFFENDDTVFLTKTVEDKMLPNGDIFSGELDAVTGDFLHGTMHYKSLMEKYEGPFRGNMRHGDGAICQKLTEECAKFVGSFKDDQFHKGTIITKAFTYTGDFASGTFSNSVFHGKGILALADKTVYEGDFRDDQYHGHGILTTPDGNRYDGLFSNGKKNGLGTMQYTDGSSYTGEWSLDMRHGNGVRTTGNNSRIYSGEFQFDHPNGAGTLMVMQDIELSGLWIQGRPVDGPGWSIRYRDKGLLFKGSVKCARPHGVGSLFKLPSERNAKTMLLYSGPFICGLPVPKLKRSDESSQVTQQPMVKITTVGDELSKLKELCIDEDPDKLPIFSEPADVIVDCCQWTKNFETILESKDSTQCPLSKIKIDPIDESRVTVTLMDGSKYVGSIGKNGVLVGSSVFTDALNGSKYVGCLQNGLKYGEGEENYNDGTRYRGTFNNGWRDGFGELISRAGEIIYSGEWKNDMHEGQGTRIYGRIHPGTYQGDFREGQRHGHGTLTTKDGTLYEGDWCNGLPLCGDWVITYSNQAVYLGCAVFNDSSSPPVPMGFGSKREPDGTFHTGNFLHGQRDGHGVCLFSNGETWEGNWKRDKFVGEKRGLG